MVVFKQIAKIKTCLERVVGLECDRASRNLPVHCDYECNNTSHVYSIGDERDFQPVAEFKMPPSHWKQNFEGIAISYQPACKNNTKMIFLADDLGRREGALAYELIPCNVVVQRQP